MIPVEHEPRERRCGGCPRSVPAVPVHHGKAITEDVDAGEAAAFENSPARLAVLLTSWPVILLGWIGLPTYIVWMGWFLRRQRAELGRLLDLKLQLTEPDT